MILVYGYYETIFWKKRATYGRNISAYDRKIYFPPEMILTVDFFAISSIQPGGNYYHTVIDTREIVFGYYETIIRKNTQPLIGI